MLSAAEGVTAMARSSKAAEKFSRFHLESTTLSEGSVFHRPIQVFSCTDNEDAGPSSSRSYVSAPIQKSIQLHSVCVNEIERKIEYSKRHWSDLDPRSCTTQAATNREIFESLRRQPQYRNFFEERFDDLVMGRKIAEGAQAEIFEACGSDGEKYVLKVFKGYSVQDLKRQWPHGMMNSVGGGNFYGGGYYHYGSNTSWVLGGMVLKDDSFAFVMPKYSGDLRSVMDERMGANNQRPPFLLLQVKHILFRIALGMRDLHRDGILHRDLKAANVFIIGDTHDSPSDLVNVAVADFECSAGLKGSRFWRAPEILHAVKMRNYNPEFTSMADVYSFGMTCYEVLSGCIPFDGCGVTNYDVVLNGHRPALPTYTPLWLVNLIHRCWDPNPLKRPDFQAIFEEIQSNY